MNWLRFFLRPPIYIAPRDQAIFRRFFLDIAWFGLVNGSIASFLVIYATRLGADATQVGLFTAVPALVNLLLALPAGRYLERQRSLSNVVWWTGLLTRIFYIVLIPLPWLLGAKAQIWAILLVTLIMNIPATILIVAFNSMFADAVAVEHRAYVAGVRNALFSIVTVVVALICGQILVSVVFPINYQIVFLIGFFGAAMSTVQFFHLRTLIPTTPPSAGGAATFSGGSVVPISRRPGLRLMTALSSLRLARLDILKGRYGRVIGLLFFFHFAQFLAIPIFPLYTVNVLGYSDQVLSIGSSLFSGLVFVGSLKLADVSRRLGNHRVTGIGVVMLGAYPLIVAFAHSVWIYIVASIIGGVAWSLAGGALYNYLLDRIPDDQRPPHLAWYNLALNAAILAGSLVAIPIANQVGYAAALIVFGLLRAAAGLAILRWG